MSKSPFKIKTSGGAVKKLAILIAILALLALVIKYPNDADDMVNTAVDHGGGIIDSFVQFFRGLRNG